MSMCKNVAFPLGEGSTIWWKAVRLEPQARRLTLFSKQVRPPSRLTFHIWYSGQDSNLRWYFYIGLKVRPHRPLGTPEYISWCVA